jgi:hypothetical protein
LSNDPQISTSAGRFFSHRFDYAQRRLSQPTVDPVSKHISASSCSQSKLAALAGAARERIKSFPL